MRKRWFGAMALSAALLVTGCGDSDKKDDSAAKPSDSLPVPTFDAGTSMARIQSAGKITVGVKFDQAGFGLKNPTTGQVEGFDIEVAKLLAQGIFGGTKDEAAKKIDFVEAQSKNREPFIQQGKVDMVVATYTINDTRKQVVDFAGPYYVAHGDIMVRSDNTNIKTVSDLNGKKVCTVKGSTYEASLKTQAPQANVTLLDTYSQCAEALRDSRVDAETTDNGILGGLVQSSNGAFKLVKTSYTDEPYGIGMKKGDDAFRTFLNDRLKTVEDNGAWKTAFEKTLAGPLGLDVPAPPAINNYSSGAATSTTVAGGATTTTVAGATTTAAPSTSTTAAH